MLRHAAWKFGILLASAVLLAGCSGTPVVGVLLPTTGDAQTLNPKRLDFEPTMVIGEFLRNKSGVVAIDGLDTMIYQNGLQKVTEFLKTVIDIAS